MTESVTNAELLAELKAVRAMLETLTSTPPASEPPAEFLDGEQAAEFSRLSVRTLQRLHADGAEVGLRKVNRRIVFHRETLARFLASRPPRD